MSSTTFVNGVTLTDADWFNDVDALIYDVFNEKLTAGTSGTILRSNGTNIVNTTATYPATTTANRIVYSTALNTIGESAANLTYDGTTLTSATASIGTGTVTTDITIPNTGLHIFDTDSSHDLIVKPGSNLTADRILTVTTGDSARTLNISAADVTVSSFGSTLVDDADNTTARATLGLVIGTDVQAYDADLAALAANATDGLWAHTGVGTGAARTLTAPAAGFTVTNPAGIAGNPTFVLANDLSALEGLGSTGIAVRSASDTWVQRSITATATQITVTNGDGVSGNPALSFPADVVIPTVLTVPNSGLHVLDTDASHDLIITPGSNLTADRVFTVTTGDAARSMTFDVNGSVQVRDTLTTKGDLYVATAATTVARQAVGTDGYLVTASSGDTNGIRYLAPGVGFALINGYLDWTVSGNALTCAIKGLDTADPSGTNPVFAWVRSATATSGVPSLVKITAANSVVVSSGSTLGTRDGIPSRIWAVLFDDAGTYRLGVINCLTTVAGAGASSDVTAIYPLSAWGIASSTAEGGAGAADSAQVFYTGTAVASKPYTVLGYATFEGGQATAGTWATAASRKQLFMPGAPLPGHVIQTQRTDTGASSTGSTTIPADDTIPQITEGDQYMTQAISPSSAASVLEVRSIVNASVNAIAYVTSALFQDATANALAAVTAYNPGSNQMSVESLSKRLLSGTTSSTTFRIRIGPSGGETVRFNGFAGTASRTFGGVFNSFLEVSEVMA
jgi:hypothetical protein